MKLSVAWKWFDLWVGAYWDAGHRTLYVCPLPTVVFRLEFRGPKDESKHRADRSRPVIPTTGILDHTPELDKAEYEALIRECNRLMGAATKAALERNEAKAENARLVGTMLSARRTLTSGAPVIDGTRIAIAVQILDKELAAREGKP